MRYRNLFLIASLLFLIQACKGKEEEKVNYPSRQYEYVKGDTTGHAIHQSVYVPIYSHIYDKDGTHVLNLTATLSIRSTDFSDSLFVSKVDYYGSNGQLIKKYIDKTLLIKPMSSVEFIVEHSETEGGAGANFVIEWSAKNPVEPIIQAVMVSTYYSAGISFVTNGIPMKTTRQQ